MVSAFGLNKELLIGYVITLKLKETIETNLPARAIPPRPQSLDSVIISIEEELDEARKYEASSPWATQSICRVPNYLREGEDTAFYTPQIVSIGPYHYGNQPLQKMEIHKRRALNHALDRTGHNIHLYLDVVRSVENRVRACYEPAKIFYTDRFATSLLLDSIFVLELFRGVKEGFVELGYPSDDPVFTNRGSTIHLLRKDMMILENQLPLFLLDRILALQRGDKSYRSCHVAPLALFFFESLRPTNDPRPSTRTTLSFDPLSNASNVKAIHCLDLLHSTLFQKYDKPRQSNTNFLMRIKRILIAIGCLKPIWLVLFLVGMILAQNLPFLYYIYIFLLIFYFFYLLAYYQLKKRFSYESKQLELIHCASELHDAGIKFKCRKTNRFWDIQFKDGVLEIPHILVVHDTKIFFLNLIAFEQSNLKCSNHITSYISFMNGLINSEVDVRYLHHLGIIEHLLENDLEVANLFNGLCRKAVVDYGDNYLLDLTRHVNSYYKSTWNTLKASFKHKYFSNPWSFSSLIFAAILLLLTLLQTLYTTYGYYKPK